MLYLKCNVINKCKKITSGDSEGQGSLVCCTPWGRKETDTTEQLNKIQAGGDWKADPNSNSIDKEADIWRQSGTCLGPTLPLERIALGSDDHCWSRQRGPFYELTCLQCVGGGRRHPIAQFYPVTSTHCITEILPGSQAPQENFRESVLG